MKNKIRLMLVLALMAPMSVMAGEKGESELEIVNRLNHTTEFTSENEINDNYFSVNRSYIGFKHNFTENISSKLLLDVVSNSKSVVTGVNGDGKDVKTELAFDGSSIRIKNAYIDFANALGPVGVTVGLANNYFAMTRDLSSSFIYYTGAAEGTFKNSSADFGITLHGKFAEMVEVEVQGVNGGGYKKYGSDKKTINPDLIANARITPIKEVMIGASLKYDKQDEKGVESNVLVAPHAKLTTDYIDIPVETVINVGDSTTFGGNTFSLYVQPEIKLKKVLNIPLYVGGAFGLNNNKDKDLNSTIIMGGVRYDVVKNVKLQASYVTTSVNGEGTGSKILGQVEYKFTNIFK